MTSVAFKHGLLATERIKERRRRGARKQKTGQNESKLVNIFELDVISHEDKKGCG